MSKTMRHPIRFLLSFLLLLLATAAQAERRVAFLVGNDHYEHAPPLANPVRDVELLARTLDGLDFEVTVHRNASRGTIADRLTAFLDETEGADVTVFYFAGHGLQFEGRNYLIGTDARLETEFDIDAEALDLDRVMRILASNSRAALVFIDACRDNPLADQFYRDSPAATRAMASRGLAPVSGGFQGAMVTFSASPGQLAADGEGANSPFAMALARHLPTANLEVLSLMKRVIRDVKSATDDLQVPVVVNDLTAEVYLQSQGGTEPADQVSPSAAWKPAFVLDLPQGAGPAELFAPPCGPGLDKSPLCGLLFGTKIDNAGAKSVAAWNIGSGESFIRARRGGEVAVSGGAVGAFQGVVPTMDGAVLFASDGLAYVTPDYGKTDTLTMGLADPATTDDFGWIKETGIYDLAYAPPLDTYAMAAFGRLIFWRDWPGADWEGRNMAGGPLIGLCTVQADGAVPWENIQFSRDGRIVAARHASWTVILELPERDRVGAAAGQLDPCPWGDWGGDEAGTAELDQSMHYFPFLALSQSGERIAMIDRETTGMSDWIMGDVVAVYDTATLNAATNEGEFERRASQADRSKGLVVNLFGHESRIARARFSPSADRLFSLTENGVLRLWSLPDGSLVRELPELDGAPIEQAEFDGDTGCLLVSARGRTSVYYDPDADRVLQEFRAPSDRFLLDAGRDLLFTYTFGERPISAYIHTGQNCGS